MEEAIKFFEKQLQKSKCNLSQAKAKDCKEEEIRNIQKKIVHFTIAIECIKRIYAQENSKKG